MKKKDIKQPSLADEQKYNEVVGDKPSVVFVRGAAWKVRWVKYGTMRRVTDILLDEKQDEGKVCCKCAAVLRLNSWWKIPLLYWLLWRIYYYVKGYSEADLMPFVEECKKKVPLENYFGCIMLLTAMKDTMMMMTRAEVNRIQVEQLSAQLGASGKSDPA